MKLASSDGADATPWLSGGAPAQLFVHGPAHPDRALVLARPQDVVCVADEVDPAYLGYLAELGLGPRPGHVVAASRFGPPAPDRALWSRLAGSADALRTLAELLQRNGITRLHPFASSGGEHSLAAALEVAADAGLTVAAADPAIVAHAAQKHHVRAAALALGVPVAAGETVELPRAGGRRRRDHDALRAAVQRQLQPTGRVLVRGTAGAAGSATFVVGGRGGEDVDGLLRRVARLEHERIFLVEVLLPASVSPHVQLHVAPEQGSITCVGVSDQRWERPFVHGGNVHPSVAHGIPAMLDWSERLGRWLQGQGYVGVLGLDFLEYLDPATGALRTILAELHPHLDGATYPLAIFQRLRIHPGVAAFVSGSLHVRPTTFARFRRAAEAFMFSPGTGCGMVPCQVGRLGHGQVGVVMLGPSRDDVLRAYGELQTWSRRGDG